MVVKEVLNVLTPRIMTLISEALSAQQAAKQQALLEQQRQEEAVLAEGVQWPPWVPSWEGRHRCQCCGTG